MRGERILILAGTAEARALANALVNEDQDVISSFAGVTREPLLPQGRIHVGGFGGVQGLVEFIVRENITHVIDATHPFAAQMSTHAVAACTQTSVPILRLERPAWRPEDGDKWFIAGNMAEAAHRIPLGARVLVTTGRKGLGALLARGDLSGIVRTIEPPDDILPHGWTLLLDRPPHALDAELQLMRQENVTCLLTKNAGGDATSAKLSAARLLGVDVVMIERPMKPACEAFASLRDVLIKIQRSQT